jgi:hypothetical protein
MIADNVKPRPERAEVVAGGLACADFIDMRAQAEVRSALRTDTPR